MINTVALTGRLTRDPELNYTGNGIAVVNFRLAVNRSFKNANGEREADFINCQGWRKTAEIIAENLNKGSLIGVEGRIQTRNYQDNDGKTIYITEVVVDNLTFLESKSSNRQGQSNIGQSNNYQGQSQGNSGQQFAPNNDSLATNEVITNISDDDLPF